jgi:hypothetical protein
MKDGNLTIDLPEYYDSDELVQFEIESKGLFMDVYVSVNEKRFRLSFYDIVRLKQDYELAIKEGAYYFNEPNLVIVPKVTKDVITKSIYTLYNDGAFDSMTAE